MNLEQTGFTKLLEGQSTSLMRYTPFTLLLETIMAKMEVGLAVSR